MESELIKNKNTMSLSRPEAEQDQNLTVQALLYEFISTNW